MKKRIIGVAVVAAMALTAGWNYNQSNNEMAMSDLALANVEALARGEAGPDWSGHKLVYPSSAPGGCCERRSSTDICSGTYNACS